MLRGTLGTACAIALLTVSGAGSGANAATVSTIWNFAGGTDGAGPVGDLIADSGGALFGATNAGGGTGCNTYGCGTVFKLSPPAAGQTHWTEGVLYRFAGGADGGTPFSGLIRDVATGAFYGTTYFGGSNNQGTVFKLAPPAAGQTGWTHTVIHNFTGPGDGAYPGGKLSLDPATGVLYGATSLGGTCTYCGVVFQLTPPVAGQTAWTETILHSFAGGTDGMAASGGFISDQAGGFYGTTGSGGTNRSGQQNVGTVFDLSPPSGSQTAWTETILSNFGFNAKAPEAGLVLKGGTLFGTTVGGGATERGTVFRLIPPAGSQTNWATKVLYTFHGHTDGGSPNAVVFAEGTHVLYGTTRYGGTVRGRGAIFSLTPPSAGTTGWTESILHSFAGGTGDGAYPGGGLLQVGGVFLGTTYGGGTGACHPGGSTGCGIIFSLTP